MTAPAVNSDNVNAISRDAVKGECIRITASDNACGERLDRFLAAAITTRNSEYGAPIDNHGLSRSRIKTLVQMDAYVRMRQSSRTPRQP